MSEKRQKIRRSKSGKAGRKDEALPISDDVRRFFPPTSRIGQGRPRPWGSVVKEPDKKKHTFISNFFTTD